MTREQAINYLRSSGMSDEQISTVVSAIERTETHSCDYGKKETHDTKIQEILEYLDTTLHPIVSPDNWNVYAELHDMISGLSCAWSEYITPTDENVESYKRGWNHALESVVENTPVVAVGHWRTMPMACYGGGTITEYECSECGEHSLIKTKFCPECGSYNGGKNEDADIS